MIARAAILLLLLLALASAAAAAREPMAPSSISKNVSIDQKLGAQVALDLNFRDESGAPVRLGDFVTDKPVVLSLVYYRCPGLCTMTLNGNTTNFFAETEQVAFHPGHLVPGIDVTNDPLLQGRLFSYIDTQITRLGGPNYNQIPVNRPHAPVNDMLRDGFHQHAVHGGNAPSGPYLGR